jgi:hypothetical protein
LETHLTAIHSEEATGGGRCREDLVRGGNLRAAASQSLWCEETEVCGTGIVAPPGAHILGVEK